MLIIKNNSDLIPLIGRELAISDWIQISQEKINLFADATGDHQWIHTDPERCRIESPFKQTIAHGHLILSLLPHLFYQVVYFQDAALTINYGLNRVRFTHPVLVDSYIRAKFHLKNLQEIPGGVRIVNQVIFDIKAQEKPACLAESILQVLW